MPPKLPKSLQLLLDKLRKAIRDLMDDFEAGDETPTTWRDTMKSLVTRFITAAFMSGQQSPLVGVSEQGFIYEYVKAQMEFLDNFYLSIVSAPEFREGWKQRAESYANSIVAPYWKGTTKMLPLPAMPGDMTTPCGQLCACLWDIVTIDEAKNDYDCYWKLNASREIETEHCQPCEVRARLWNPLQVRDGRLIVPQGEAGKEYVEHVAAALKHLPGQHDQLNHGNRFGPGQGKNAGETSRNKRLQLFADKTVKDLEKKGITGVTIIVDRQHFEQYKPEYSVDIPAAFSREDGVIRVNPAAKYWRNPSREAETQFGMKFWSTNNRNQTLIHEVGHKLHWDKFNGDDYRWFNLNFIGMNQVDIASKVSGYSTYKPTEFVAETFAGLYAGKSYDSDVMDLYNLFGGTIP